MARTPSFDRAAVVRAARAVFWRDGYESAAVPRLEEATGLSRSSLYGAFGSKRGLFDAAVQSYLDEVVRPRLAPLEAPEVARDALRDYLSGLRAAFVGVDASAPTPGCLLINTAAGPVGADPEVARVIAEYRAELHAAIRRGVDARTAVSRDPAHAARSAHAAHAAHTDSADSAEQLATVIAGLVVSAFALVRVDPAAAVASLDAALHAIDTDPAGRDSAGRDSAGSDSAATTPNPAGAPSAPATPVPHWHRD